MISQLSTRGLIETLLLLGVDPTGAPAPSRTIAVDASRPVRSPVLSAQPERHRLQRLLNAHAIRFGRCGRDRWRVTLGDQGSMRLARRFEALPLEDLLGREAHRCALLHLEKQRFHWEVRAHVRELDHVGVSRARGEVTLFCRFEKEACLQMKSVGSPWESHHRVSLALSRDRQGLGEVALAVHRIVRLGSQDPRTIRRPDPAAQARRRRSGALERGFGIGLTILGLGASIGTGYNARYVFRGVCQAWLAAEYCLERLPPFLAAMLVLEIGVYLWISGQWRLWKADQLDQQAARDIAVGAAPPRPVPTLPPEPGIPPPGTGRAAVLSWTLRF